MGEDNPPTPAIETEGKKPNDWRVDMTYILCCKFVKNGGACQNSVLHPWGYSFPMTQETCTKPFEPKCHNGYKLHPNCGTGGGVGDNGVLWRDLMCQGKNECIDRTTNKPIECVPCTDSASPAPAPAKGEPHCVDDWRMTPGCWPNGGLIDGVMWPDKTCRGDVTRQCVEHATQKIVDCTPCTNTYVKVHDNQMGCVAQG